MQCDFSALKLHCIQKVMATVKVHKIANFLVWQENIVSFCKFSRIIVLNIHVYLMSCSVNVNGL